MLSYLQGIVDEKQTPGMFILTGSQNLSLMNKVTQSLAGRTALLKLLPFSLDELRSSKLVQNFSLDDYLLTGFFPRIYDNNLDPTKAYRYYFETYIERDVRQLANLKDVHLFQKFVRLCAGRIGQIFVLSQLANEVGVSSGTIKSWISILEASYIMFLLPPYFSNINKRLIKSPKLYFYDVGLAAYLLGIENVTQIKRDPLRGALFENLVVAELMKYRFNKALDSNMYFYRDSHQNEVDVICKTAHELIGIEIKSAATFHYGFIKNLKYIRGIFKQALKKNLLVYTGDLEQSLDDCMLVNYKTLIKKISQYF